MNGVYGECPDCKGLMDWVDFADDGPYGSNCADFYKCRSCGKTYSEDAYGNVEEVA